MILYKLNLLSAYYAISTAALSVWGELLLSSSITSGSICV
jgi:hypothetical protein